MPTPSSPLAQHAERLGDKPAVIDDRPDGALTVWTFTELNRQANRLANVLLALGLKAGDKIVWCGQNSGGIVRGDVAVRVTSRGRQAASSDAAAGAAHTRRRSSASTTSATPIARRPAT